jgi:hypothetical protein
MIGLTSDLSRRSPAPIDPFGGTKADATSDADDVSRLKSHCLGSAAGSEAGDTADLEVHLEVCDTAKAAVLSCL